VGGIETRSNGGAAVGHKPRVFVAAENRLLREALSRMLLKSGEVEVVGTDLAEPFQTDDLLKEEANILLLSSRGNRNEDLSAVRRVRTTAPKVQILLIGVTGEEAEFLQCVREFTVICRKKLRRRTWWRVCGPCREAKRFAPACFAQHCSGTWNEKRPRSLPRACTNGWD